MKLLVQGKRNDFKFYEFVFIGDMAIACHENPRKKAFRCTLSMIPNSPFDGFQIAEP